MSHFDYQASKQIVSQDHPFYALIMAAYRQADTQNAALIEAAWPDVVVEIHARYNAPGGHLPSDPRGGE